MRACDFFALFHVVMEVDCSLFIFIFGGLFYSFPGVIGLVETVSRLQCGVIPTIWAGYGFQIRIFKARLVSLSS